MRHVSRAYRVAVRIIALLFITRMNNDRFVRERTGALLLMILYSVAVISDGRGESPASLVARKFDTICYAVGVNSFCDPTNVSPQQ